MWKKLKAYIKVDDKIIKFNDPEIEEFEFHQHKSLISINNIDINKLVISNKLLFGKQVFKYFIGYKDAKKIDLYAYSIQKWVYKRNFDKARCMYFQ